MEFVDLHIFLVSLLTVSMIDPGGYFKIVAWRGDICLARDGD